MNLQRFFFFLVISSGISLCNNYYFYYYSNILLFLLISFKRLNFVKLYHISLGQNAHAGGGETSDCESYRKKVDTSAGTQQTQNIASSQASLHSASSSQPEVHPFFKVFFFLNPFNFFVFQSFYL